MRISILPLERRGRVRGPSDECCTDLLQPTRLNLIDGELDTPTRLCRKVLRSVKANQSESFTILFILVNVGREVAELLRRTASRSAARGRRPPRPIDAVFCAQRGGRSRPGCLDLIALRQRPCCAASPVTPKDGAHKTFSQATSAPPIASRRRPRDPSGEIAQTGEQDPLALVDRISGHEGRNRRQMAGRHTAASTAFLTPLEPCEKGLIESRSMPLPPALLGGEVERFVADGRCAWGGLPHFARTPSTGSLEEVNVYARRGDKQRSLRPCSRGSAMRCNNRSPISAAHEG